VLGQSESNLELIVVNDGSTDRSAAIIMAEIDPRIYVIHQPNKGPGAARNHGMRLAQADYVSFLDADDELLPEFVAIGLRVLEENPDCALVNFSWLLGAGREDQSILHRAKGIKEGKYCVDGHLNPTQLKQQLDYMHSGAIMVRKNVVEGLGGYYEDRGCTYGEDSYLWIQIMLDCVVYRLPSPLMWFHCENSELGVGRKTVHPIVPQLVEHQTYLRKFPRSQRSLVRRLYSDYLFLAMDRSYKGRSLAVGQQALRLIPAVFQPERACVYKERRKNNFPSLPVLAKLGRMQSISPLWKDLVWAKVEFLHLSI
jgi:glycosyltransferase involved in cell wall biosynthesis